MPYIVSRNMHYVLPPSMNCC